MDKPNLPIHRANGALSTVTSHFAITERLHGAIQQRQGDDAVLVAQGGVVPHPSIMALSPDDVFLVVGNREALQIWNLQERVCLYQIPLAVEIIVFSPDGKLCLTVGSEVRLWTTSNWKNHVVPIEADAGITAVAISSDKRNIAIGSSGGSITIYDLHTATVTKAFGEDVGRISNLLFSPASNQIVVISYKQPHAQVIQRWDIHSGSKTFSTIRIYYLYHPETFFWASGKLLGLCSHDTIIRAYDVLSKKRIRQFDVHPHRKINDVYISADHKKLIVCHDGERRTFLRCWDISSGRCIQSFDSNSVRITVLNGGNQLLAKNVFDDYLALWDFIYGVEVARFGKKFLYVHDISDDGVYYIQYDEETSTAHLAYNFNNKERVFLDAVMPLSIKFLHSKLLCQYKEDPLAQDCTIEVKDYKEAVGCRVRLSLTKGERILRIAMSEDSKLLLTASSSEVLKSWDIRLHTILPDSNALLSWECNTSDKLHLPRIALSPDTRFSFASTSNGITIWYNISGKIKGQIETDGFTTDFCITPDSKKLLYCDNSGVCIWDIEHSALISTFTGHSGCPSAVCISPDGRWAASGDNDGCILLWNIADGSIITTFSGHTACISKLVIVSDKKMLVSGADDGTVRYWDIATGKELACCYMTKSGVVTVTPDKRYDTPDGRCEYLRWTIDNKSYPLEYLKDRYYTPGLLKEVLGNHFNGEDDEEYNQSSTCQNSQTTTNTRDTCQQLLSNAKKNTGKNETDRETDQSTTAATTGSAADNTSGDRGTERAVAPPRFETASQSGEQQGVLLTCQREFSRR